MNDTRNMLVASPHLCRVGGSKVCNITLIVVSYFMFYVYIHARASTADHAFEIVLAEFFLIGEPATGSSTSSYCHKGLCD